MLSRDFVKAFLLGQTEAGKTLDEAKLNFGDWLADQSESIASEADKQAILNDLGSYKVE